jgi:PAS domain-containing protein
MKTPSAIHAEIQRDSERRAELWQLLARGHDAAVSADIRRLDEQIAGLWEELRAVRATMRFGERTRIVARARAEERLERAA